MGESRGLLQGPVATVHDIIGDRVNKIPYKWLVAKVSIVFKAGDKNDVRDNTAQHQFYLFFSKGLGKLMHLRIEIHL